MGHAVANLVEALLYKPEGRWFTSRWCQRNFFMDIILPAALNALGLNRTLTEMNTRNIYWGGGLVKAAGVWGWQPYHLRVPFILKSRSLNLLETSLHGWFHPNVRTGRSSTQSDINQMY